MSNCGYFRIQMGKVSCTHPNNGYIFTESFKGKLNKRCNRCRKECGGIFPSQLPSENYIEWNQDIIDKSGNIIVTQEEMKCNGVCET